MEIKIKLFTVLRDAAGKEEVIMPWRQGMTYLDLLGDLKKKYTAMASLLESSFVSVNGRFAERGIFLMPEDEVAVLPPVSGG